MTLASLALSLALAAYSWRTLRQARLERMAAENDRAIARKVMRAALVVAALNERRARMDGVLPA